MQLRHLYLALQKEFESPTFRLGGGRSIRLSYWCVFCPVIVTKKSRPVNKNSEIIFFAKHILSGRTLRGGENMDEKKEHAADIDDLIFGEEETGPSQR